jgi:hypothetical protein
MITPRPQISPWALVVLVGRELDSIERFQIGSLYNSTASVGGMPLIGIRYSLASMAASGQFVDDGSCR